MWLFLDFVVPELNTSTAEVLFGMAWAEPCLACENWSLQLPKAAGDQNLGGVVFAVRHRSWFKPTKNCPEVEGIDQDICGAGVWITPGAVSHHPRGGIAASSLKMQRGVESTVLEKAQIGPVFRKPTKTEMSSRWSQNVQPPGTRNVCGFAWWGTVLFPGECALRASERSLDTWDRFLLNKTSRFCEEELLTAVRIYRLGSCACTSGAQVQTSRDMSELIFS